MTQLGARRTRGTSPHLLQAFRKFHGGKDIVLNTDPVVKQTRVQILSTSLIISGTLGKGLANLSESHFLFSKR